MEFVIGLSERARHVRAASSIGLAVALLFSVYNLVTPGLLVLGLIELAAALCLLAPAVFMSHTPSRVAAAETLLLLCAAVIFGALIVTGGIEGTGLFWVYTVPFLAFFLKGQRLGWIYSLVFLGVVAVYFVAMRPALAGVHQFSAVVSVHFLLSLSFYTLVAAAFNHVRSRFEAQLQQRKEHAEAASLAKSRFLAAASHDLRQPAHALGLFVARLTQLPHDAQTQALVAGVDASVRALQDMLDTFFDYSRLDAPSMQVRSQAFPVNHLFEQLRTSFAGVAAGKGLRLRIRPSNLWLQTDPVLLYRVLLNLVSNALQHTQQGTVLVACRPGFRSTHARIEVWDSGVGIAPEHHARIFEEFFQVGNAERDRSKGLGLGLSIVQRSCRLLNLPLSLHSSLGRGSRFCLQVPATVAQLSSLPLGAADSPMAAFDGLQVLLVEDDVLGGAALTGLLESWGCHVTVTDTALGACALARLAPPPDMIVSDFRLRGPDNGIEAVRMVRDALGFDVAACLISGDTAQAVREQVQAAGLVLLQKPVRPAKLRSVLRHAAQGKKTGPVALDAA
ncbi:MAG: hybrid sensor histidine kinase/response regulator [Rhodoferax sp.]|uniref:ATP-binding response regulator n=1 Tax=Rhodoferax sp. TaxID=50421 RepID=UPI0026370C55|nr:hybrid sensor histidine kinase/response regulator [Rhodoferax sp.]MDD2881778.1 hybrid sensor histidine kinase/response regulator [Rhodoferax sp.]